jgi:hypothetical protein
VSPSVSGWPSKLSPTTTSPVLMPVWVRRCTSQRRASSSLSGSSAARISSAARAARAASSSCTTGTPNTTMKPSPMNFSTVPPWRATTSRMAAK